MASNQRLSKELSTLSNDTTEFNIIVTLLNGNLFEWKIEVDTPDDDVYRGKRVKMQLTFNKEYPFKPPTARFITKLYHPNISFESGDVCIDILKDKWRPILTAKNIIISIISMLSDPNCDSPLNSAAAIDYSNNKELYYSKVRDILNRA